MNVEQYKIRAAEFRAHMEDPDLFENPHTTQANKLSPYLPGGEKRSVRVRLPVPDVDLSALNGKGWKTSKENGSRGGNRTVRRRKAGR